MNAYEDITLEDVSGANTREELFDVALRCIQRSGYPYEMREEDNPIRALTLLASLTMDAYLLRISLALIERWNVKNYGIIEGYYNPQ